MQFKFVVALFVASVALCAFVPQFVDAGPSDFWLANKWICDPTSAGKSDNYKCGSCCTHRQYTKHKSTYNTCTCYKKGSEKMRPSDEVREYHGLIGSSFTTHEFAEY